MPCSGPFSFRLSNIADITAVETLKKPAGWCVVAVG